MFLAHTEIAALAAEGKLIGEGYKADRVKQASYDLALGAEVYVVGKGHPIKLSDEEPYLTLAPGEFAILTCLEEIRIPSDHIAFIALKSSFKFQGLVNISGFHVDPTYNGKLLFAVQNVGPSDLRLKYGRPTFTIFFARLVGNILKSRDKDAQTEFKGVEGIRLQDVQLLGGSSVTITKLQQEIAQLRFIMFIYTPVVVAILAALIKLFWPTAPTPPALPGK
jgi:dCTP deaminase